VSDERDERQRQHFQMLKEHLIAECRDNIVDYQRGMDAAAARGNEHERKMYEGWLSSSRERLAWAEARQLPA
jgi:hypothetical protein